MKKFFKTVYDWFVGLNHMATVIFLLVVQFSLIAYIFWLFNIEAPSESFAVAGFTWGITMITIMLIGMKSMDYLMSRAHKAELEEMLGVAWKKKLELEKLQSQKDELNKRIQDLEGDVAKKASEIDTMRQTQSLVASYNKSRELQILTVSKSGNIVKEEELFPLRGVKDLSENFPKKHFCWRLFYRDVIREDNWKVFYSDNKVYKYGVGIKFDDIYYAVDSNVIYFKNVKLSRLHRHEVDCGKKNTNHVWIVTRDENRHYSIINDPQHTDFIDNYREFQRKMTGRSIQNAIDNLCEYFTTGLHNILIARYGDNIHFVQENEDLGHLNWRTLSEGLRISDDVRTFMNDLYLAFDAMELCADNNPQLDQSLIPEKTSA